MRPAARYERSLELLATSRRLRPEIATKTGIMLGLGESEAEVRETLRGYVSPREYRLYTIDAPDLAFENREDPNLHHFRTVTGRRKVEIWGLRR